jgi:hypothetical protein
MVSIQLSAIVDVIEVHMPAKRNSIADRLAFFKQKEQDGIKERVQHVRRKSQLSQKGGLSLGQQFAQEQSQRMTAAGKVHAASSVSDSKDEVKVVTAVLAKTEDAPAPAPTTHHRRRSSVKDLMAKFNNTPSPYRARSRLALSAVASIPTVAEEEELADNVTITGEKRSLATLLASDSTEEGSETSTAQLTHTRRASVIKRRRRSVARPVFNAEDVVVTVTAIAPENVDDPQTSDTIE